MELEMEYSTKDIWNVIGSINGYEEPDRLVIIGARVIDSPPSTRLAHRGPIINTTGNHRDAWVYGAGDPHSGTSTMLEVARALSVCVQNGWRPKRTIMFCR